MKSFLLITLLALSCARETTQTTDTSPANTDTTPTTATAPVQPAEIKEGLQTPESVLYVADQDVYLVSNINGQPLAADNNGYITRVNAESLKAEKWIEAGKKNVTLNAPKGSAIMGDTLYVADLDTVRKFDAKTGEPKGAIKIPGATFLNDVATDGTSVFVTDSGMKAGANGNFDPTGTDAVWQISGDKPKKIASGKDLNRPNGIVADGGKLYVVSFAANELYQLDKGKKTNVVQLPKGSLDGLVHLGGGDFLVSSWESNSVFRGPAGGPFNEVITNVNAPADIGYDSKRNRLLVPHFMENRVTLHSLQ